MIDKIKDFLYDISDIFFSLLIIMVIFFVVTWKISSSMSFDLLPTYFGSSEDSQKELSEVKVIHDSPTSTDPTDPSDSLIPESPSTENNPVDASDEDGNDTSTTDSPDISGNDDSTVKVIEDIKITIAPGSTGHSIAKQLLDHQLVPDINTFSAKVEEMNLGGKLQSGSFTLSSGDTLEDMIRVLCGKSREDR